MLAETGSLYTGSEIPCTEEMLLWHLESNQRLLRIRQRKKKLERTDRAELSSNIISFYKQKYSNGIHI